MRGRAGIAPARYSPRVSGTRLRPRRARGRGATRPSCLGPTDGMSADEAAVCPRRLAHRAFRRADVHDRAPFGRAVQHGPHGAGQLGHRGRDDDQLTVCERVVERARRQCTRHAQLPARASPRPDPSPRPRPIPCALGGQTDGGADQTRADNRESADHSLAAESPQGDHVARISSAMRKAQSSA